jgi:sialate O-acetylesterase
MAVSIDIGEPTNIHPKNKQPVSNRLALIALKKTYNYKNITCDSPLYKSMKTEGNKIRILFDYAEWGLKSNKNDPIKGFAIAGDDKKFVWANAKIEGSTILVWSEQISKPVAVRYGWADWIECNLYNKKDMPVSPFRTDGD